jgi:DNA polymerase III subunit delta'
MKWLIGHATQRERLETLWRRNSLAHAMVFAGWEGVGKQRAALEFAGTLLCTNQTGNYGGCGECLTCTQLKEWVAPDFHYVEASNKDEWNVDGFRALLSRLQLKAFNGGSRVVLINDADCLSIQVANILLKIVEEPRPDLYFVFVAQNPSKLPKTLLSRCQLWHFDRLSDDEVATLLAEQVDETQQVTDQLIKLADGSVGNFARQQALEPLWQVCQEKLQRIEAGDIALAVEFAETLKSDKGSLTDWLRVLLLVGKQKRDAMLSGNAQNASVQKWSLFVRNCLQAEYLINERHLAAFGVLQMLFLDLATGNGDLIHHQQSSSLHERIGL